MEPVISISSSEAPTSFPAAMRPTLLRIAQVRARVALSRSAIYARIKEGSFPEPVNLGPKAVAWIDSEIDSWIAARIADRRGSLPRVA